jgi:hypothetical protein
MTSGSLTLSEHPSDLVTIVCERCDRRGRYHRHKLIQRFGPDAALPDILRELADCTKASGHGNDMCRVRYEGL